VIITYKKYSTRGTGTGYNALEEKSKANLSVELVGRFSVSLSRSWSRVARWVSLNHLHLTSFEYTLKLLYMLSGSDIG
jgi:hypothetical protein